MKEQKVSVPVTLELRQITYDALTKNIEGGQYVTTSTIANKANKLFEELASGGMVLTSDQVNRIEKTINKVIMNGNDVVNAATKKVGVENNMFVVEVLIDPAFIETVTIRAAEVGVTPAKLLSDCVNYSIGENWIYNLQPEAGPKWFDSKGMSVMKRLTGKDDPTGTEMAEAVAVMLKEEKAA